MIQRCDQAIKVDTDFDPEFLFMPCTYMKIMQTTRFGVSLDEIVSELVKRVFLVAF